MTSQSGLGYDSAPHKQKSTNSVATLILLEGKIMRIDTKMDTDCVNLAQAGDLMAVSRGAFRFARALKLRRVLRNINMPPEPLEPLL